MCEDGFSLSDSLRLRYCVVTGDTKSCNVWFESMPPSRGGTISNFSPVVFTRVQKFFKSSRNKTQTLCMTGILYDYSDPKTKTSKE